jgi:hypothetical protein
MTVDQVCQIMDVVPDTPSVVAFRTYEVESGSFVEIWKATCDSAQPN